MRRDFDLLSIQTHFIMSSLYKSRLKLTCSNRVCWSVLAMGRSIADLISKYDWRLCRTVDMSAVKCFFCVNLTNAQRTGHRVFSLSLSLIFPSKDECQRPASFEIACKLIATCYLYASVVYVGSFFYLIYFRRDESL